MSKQNKKTRTFHAGMGQAVAERTILRKKEDGRWETWNDVAHRVALGNAKLCKDKEEQEKEYEVLYRHLLNATTLMSGRHLQHGDELQAERNMEVFTNCSTSSTSFMLFYLLMNGSGVGRSYDDDMMLVDWDNAPALRCVLDENHPNFDFSAHESVRDAKHKYGSGKDVLWHLVDDTREGWAKALEIWENAAFEKIHKDKLFILDFSAIRPKGAPINGMQKRPASGPVPLMNAFNKAATMKNTGLPRWMQTIYIDHYFAECVLVGGARRAARMSTKTWEDESVLEFITIKRPIEFTGKNVEEITEIRKNMSPMGFLWSSNNSITVDQEFWRLLNVKKGSDEYNSEIAKHARSVYKLAVSASYGDGTGEPGFINVDKLNQDKSGTEKLISTECLIGSKKYSLNDDTHLYINRLLKKAVKKQNFMITNPCGEISIAVWGAFCTIADVVPYHAETLDEAEEAFRSVTRALIRVNTMDSVYKKEVKRTNRIGVGITGIHEFAWKFFKLGFSDLVDEEKSKDFWMAMSRFKRAVQDEAKAYSKKLGVTIPHSDTTIKPAGTTSKLFGLTEGWHLPSMRWYLRWVQFSKSDPLVKKYEKSGYPVRELTSYQNTVIVGFPTTPVITELGMEDRLVTASEASPEDQYKWLMLGEKYWIRGVDEKGNLLEKDTGNQISYTLKYNPNKVDFKQFSETLKENQSRIKCCSVMPQEDRSSYEYLPEEAVTKAEYENVIRTITSSLKEDVDQDHVRCDGGACPIDFKKEA
jgi:adenosylcobalamin-dependent ribonucleoside-triphosphate reductase